MTWVKLDASYYFDPKVERVSPLAELLFVRGLCHAKAHLTDGLISPRALAGIAPEDYDADGDRIAPERLAAELVRTGLWVEERDEGRLTGWRVAAWLEHNEPADAVRAKRTAEAERVRAYRADKARGRTRVRNESVRAYANESVRASEESREDAEESSLPHDDDTSTPSTAPASLEREHLIDAALRILAEHDTNSAKRVDNRRAYKATALRNRRAEDLDELERLADEHPDATPQDLADAILSAHHAQTAHEPGHGARSGPCDLCGLDWQDAGHGRAHAEAIAGLHPSEQPAARPNLTAIAGGRA